MENIFAQTLFIGKNIINLPKCHSTNAIAADLIAREQVPEGTLVTTEHQTAGRGQRGNSWETAAGKNLTFSLILKPSFLQVEEQFYLSIITSLAIYDLLTELLPSGLAVKWPNDLYYIQRKLGGILIENTLKNTSISWSVLGIGLNINQKVFQTPTATSLALVTGEEFSRSTLLEKLLSHLEKRYLQLRRGLRQDLRKEYLSRLYWLGEKHTFRSDGLEFPGKIIGVDQGGRLALQQEGEGLRYFRMKEIEFVN